MRELRSGFTSFTNDSIRDYTLPDHLYRFSKVLESHMGVKGKAKVKLSTIAREMGKERKSAERSLKWFLRNSNLKVKKIGYLYEFYTDPISSVLYGKTRVSHIVPHERTTIKRSIEKEVYKNNIDNLITNNTNIRESQEPMVLSEEELSLVNNIAKWFSQSANKSILSYKQNLVIAKGALRKHGFEKLNNIYNEVATTGVDPHPSNLWKWLKDKEISVQKVEKSV